MPKLYTEQMDAEGLGRKLLLTPSGDPAQPLKSRPWVQRLQALSSSLNAGAVKGGCLAEERLLGALRQSVPRTAASIYTLMNNRVSNILAHVLGIPCHTTRVAADFLRILGLFRRSSGIALHPAQKALSHLSPFNCQGCRPLSCL